MVPEWNPRRALVDVLVGVGVVLIILVLWWWLYIVGINIDDYLT